MKLKKINETVCVVLYNTREEIELRSLLQVHGYSESIDNIQQVISDRDQPHKFYTIYPDHTVNYVYEPYNVLTFAEFKKKYMEPKEIKIIPPEGYEIDKENSTFECVKFKKKSLTYNDVVEALFNDKKCHFISSNGIIEVSDVYNADPNNATSKKQLEKLLAINKLMNVAKYLNGDWQPDWKSREYKYFLCIDCDNILVTSVVFYCSDLIYFRTKELAQQAIDILGEDTIRLALSTDW